MEEEWNDEEFVDDVAGSLEEYEEQYASEPITVEDYGVIIAGLLILPLIVLMIVIMAVVMSP